MKHDIIEDLFQGMPDPEYEKRKIEQETRKRAAELKKEAEALAHQEMIKAAHGACMAVLKAMQEAEPIERVLLKALEGLSQATNTPEVYENGKQILSTVYAYGLNNSELLAVEIERTSTTNCQLKAAYEGETDEKRRKVLRNTIQKLTEKQKDLERRREKA